MEKRSKRNSILKKPNEDDTEGKLPLRTSRRISFCDTKSVKEFVVGPEQVTLWGNSYEECTDIIQPAVRRVSKKQFADENAFVGETNPQSVTKLHSFGSLQRESGSKSALATQNSHGSSLNITENSFTQITELSDDIQVNADERRASKLKRYCKIMETTVDLINMYEPKDVFKYSEQDFSLLRNVPHGGLDITDNMSLMSSDRVESISVHEKPEGKLRRSARINQYMKPDKCSTLGSLIKPCLNLNSEMKVDESRSFQAENNPGLEVTFDDTMEESYDILQGQPKVEPHSKLSCRTTICNENIDEEQIQSVHATNIEKRGLTSKLSINTEPESMDIDDHIQSHPKHTMISNETRYSNMRMEETLRGDILKINRTITRNENIKPISQDDSIELKANIENIEPPWMKSKRGGARNDTRDMEISISGSKIPLNMQTLDERVDTSNIKRLAVRQHYSNVDIEPSSFEYQDMKLPQAQCQTIIFQSSSENASKCQIPIFEDSLCKSQTPVLENSTQYIQKIQEAQKPTRRTVYCNEDVEDDEAADLTMTPHHKPETLKDLSKLSLKLFTESMDTDDSEFNETNLHEKCPPKTHGTFYCSTDVDETLAMNRPLENIPRMETKNSIFEETCFVDEVGNRIRHDRTVQRTIIDNQDLDESSLQTINKSNLHIQQEKLSEIDIEDDRTVTHYSSKLKAMCQESETADMETSHSHLDTKTMTIEDTGQMKNHPRTSSKPLRRTIFYDQNVEEDLTQGFSVAQLTLPNKSDAIPDVGGTQSMEDVQSKYKSTKRQTLHLVADMDETNIGTDSALEDYFTDPVKDDFGTPTGPHPAMQMNETKQMVIDERRLLALKEKCSTSSALEDYFTDPVKDDFDTPTEPHPAMQMNETKQMVIDERRLLALKERCSASNNPSICQQGSNGVSRDYVGEHPTEGGKTLKDLLPDIQSDSKLKEANMYYNPQLTTLSSYKEMELERMEIDSPVHQQFKKTDAGTEKSKENQISSREVRRTCFFNESIQNESAHGVDNVQEIVCNSRDGKRELVKNDGLELIFDDHTQELQRTGKSIKRRTLYCNTDIDETVLETDSVDKVQDINETRSMFHKDVTNANAKHNDPLCRTITQDINKTKFMLDDRDATLDITNPDRKHNATLHQIIAQDVNKTKLMLQDIDVTADITNPGGKENTKAQNTIAEHRCMEETLTHDALITGVRQQERGKSEMCIDPDTSKAIGKSVHDLSKNKPYPSTQNYRFKSFDKDIENIKTMDVVELVADRKQAEALHKPISHHTQIDNLSMEQTFTPNSIGDATLNKTKQLKSKEILNRFSNINKVEHPTTMQYTKSDISVPERTSKSIQIIIDKTETKNEPEDCKQGVNRVVSLTSSKNIVSENMESDSPVQEQSKWKITAIGDGVPRTENYQSAARRTVFLNENIDESKTEVVCAAPTDPLPQTDGTIQSGRSNLMDVDEYPKSRQTKSKPAGRHTLYCNADMDETAPNDYPIMSAILSGTKNAGHETESIQTNIFQQMTMGSQHLKESLVESERPQNMGKSKDQSAYNIIQGDTRRETAHIRSGKYTEITSVEDQNTRKASTSGALHVDKNKGIQKFGLSQAREDGKSIDHAASYTYHDKTASELQKFPLNTDKTHHEFRLNSDFSRYDQSFKNIEKSECFEHEQMDVADRLESRDNPQTKTNLKSRHTLYTNLDMEQTIAPTKIKCEEVNDVNQLKSISSDAGNTDLSRKRSKLSSNTTKIGNEKLNESMLFDKSKSRVVVNRDHILKSDIRLNSKPIKRSSDPYQSFERKAISSDILPKVSDGLTQSVPSEEPSKMKRHTLYYNESIDKENVQELSPVHLKSKRKQMLPPNEISDSRNSHDQEKKIQSQQKPAKRRTIYCNSDMEESPIQLNSNHHQKDITFLQPRRHLPNEAVDLDDSGADLSPYSLSSRSRKSLRFDEDEDTSNNINKTKQFPQAGVTTDNHRALNVTSNLSKTRNKSIASKVKSSISQLPSEQISNENLPIPSIEKTTSPSNGQKLNHVRDSNEIEEISTPDIPRKVQRFNENLKFDNHLFKQLDGFKKINISGIQQIENTSTVDAECESNYSRILLNRTFLDEALEKSFAAFKRSYLNRDISLEDRIEDTRLSLIDIASLDNTNTTLKSVDHSSCSDNRQDATEANKSEEADVTAASDADKESSTFAPFDIRELAEFSKKPKLSETVRSFMKDVHECSRFSIHEEPQSIISNITEFYDNIITSFHKEKNRAAEQLMLRKRKNVTPFRYRLEKMWKSFKSNWILNELLLHGNILRFTHGIARTLAISIYLTPDDPKGYDVTITDIRVTSNERHRREWSPFEHLLNYHLLLEIPIDLKSLCPRVEELLTFLGRIENIVQDVNKMCKNLWKHVLISPASLIKDSRAFPYIRKCARYVDGADDVQCIEVLIEVQNIKKLSIKSIKSPPLSQFNSQIHSLPTGVAFVEKLLADTVSYLKI